MQGALWNQKTQNLKSVFTHSFLFMQNSEHGYLVSNWNNCIREYDFYKKGMLYCKVLVITICTTQFECIHDK